MAGLIWLWQQPGDGPEPEPEVTYMHAPDIPDDEPRRFSALEIVMLWAGADQSGIARCSQQPV